MGFALVAFPFDSLTWGGAYCLPLEKSGYWLFMISSIDIVLSFWRVTNEAYSPPPEKDWTRQGYYRRCPVGSDWSIVSLKCVKQEASIADHSACKLRGWIKSPHPARP